MTSAFIHELCGIALATDLWPRSDMYPTQPRSVADETDQVRSCEAHGPPAKNARPAGLRPCPPRRTSVLPRAPRLRAPAFVVLLFCHLVTIVTDRQGLAPQRAQRRAATAPHRPALRVPDRRHRSRI